LSAQDILGVLGLVIVAISFVVWVWVLRGLRETS
jgi:HAMP domain-containing protein